MRNRLILTAALALSCLSTVNISIDPVNAQGSNSGQSMPSASQQLQGIPNLRMYKELTDPRTGYHPVTMPDGDAMGPNIPGRIQVGPLQATPEASRVCVGAFFILLLLISGVWGILGYNEMTRILARDFGDQKRARHSFAKVG